MIFLAPIHLIVLLTACFLSTLAAREYTSDQVRQLVQAKAALLYDANTGQVLYQRNIDEPYAPASTTKLMTALLVYEQKGLNGTLTVRREDTRVQPSSVPLISGESVRVNDLVNALLIGSDNDAAMALARYTAGSSEAFVELMNERARQLGCTQTHFCNPHGLTEAGIKTSARDLRRIFQQVISIPALRKICQTKTFTLVTERGPQKIENHNKLLGRYPGMGPAKTGWTNASRHTYAAAASRNGHELQLIILNSPDKWKDATLLFDYGFSRLSNSL